jgi:bifunctional enzyme CysN/CysC
MNTPTRPPNLTWHPSADASAALRRACLGQRGVTAWLTGLSGSGKSTISVEVERRLLEAGVVAARLDGDNLRHGLNTDCGFDAAGRAEAVRRAGEAAALLSGAGLVTLVGMISPYRADRDRVRARHAACGVAFLEVFVDAPLAVAESRDPKGLYARARAGEIRGFTGIDDPYEAPAAPEVRLPTGERGAEDCAQLLVDAIVSAARRE